MGIAVIETDVLIVGGGTAGLAFAIHYADMVRQYNEDPANTAKLPGRVMLIEKGGAIGHHSLSGAVINPAVFAELLPDVDPKDYPFESPVIQDDTMFFTKHGAFKLPFAPPYMSNKGNHVVMLGKLVRWLAEIAEKKGVQIFSGFSGHELILDNGKLAGIRTGASGLDHNGKPMVNYQPPTDVRARIVILAEGSRGNLTRDLVKAFDLAKGRNPQVYSLGVKELWEIPEGVFKKGQVVHSLGYPFGMDQFGGGFIYGLSKTLVAVGMVAGLDIADPAFDTQRALQIYKDHPFVSKVIKNGKMLRYGAKTIPEGGLFALPQLYHDNVMIVGDAAGFLAMPSLKGVHASMRSGMLAAQTAYEAFKKNDTSSAGLSRYAKLFKESPVYKELYPVRNFRQAFTGNIVSGAFQFGTQIFTGGRGLSWGGRLAMAEDRAHCRPLCCAGAGVPREAASCAGSSGIDKETAVFFSGTKHDEEQPSHIKVQSDAVCDECIKKYGGPCQHFCPAQVFEISADPHTGKKSLKLHPSNCVHCKTCDIKDPYSNVIWATPYGGDGPEYENM